MRTDPSEDADLYCEGYLSSHLGNWDNIDFDDRRQVADIILSQVHATADRVSFEWKI